MGFNYSDNSISQTFNERRSRFDELSAAGKRLQARETEASLLSVRKDLEDLRLDSGQNNKLKKTGLSSYRRSSVDAYVDELKRSTNQLKDSMELQIQSLSAECMRLKSESQVLRGQLVQAEEQTNQVKDMLSAVTSERDEAEQRNLRAGEELKALESKVSFYESENTRTEDLEGALREKADALMSATAENEQLKERIKSFSKEVESIYGELAKYKDRKSAESAEISRLHQQLSLLREDNEALQTELDDARTQLGSNFSYPGDAALQSQLREENAALMEKYSALYAEYKKELGRSSSLSRENDALSGRLEEYRKNEHENEILRKKDLEQRSAIEQLQNMINSLLEDARHQQELYDALSAECSRNKELVYSLTHDRSDLQVQNVDLQVQNVDLLDKNEKLNQRISDLEGENTRLDLLLRQKQTPSSSPLLRTEQPDNTDNAARTLLPDSIKSVRTIKNLNR